MSTVSEKFQPPPGLTYGEPVWEIARLYSPQGCWSESEYLRLDTNRRVEFSYGYIEFLPMPTILHERILRFLFQVLNAFASTQGLGEVFFAGAKVRLWEGKFRVPDVLFIRAEHRHRITADYCDGADLVMEVVSGSDSD